MTERPEGFSWLRVLGWAAYLACSWTWCIGMFLPVLLVRDYGVWGFVAFAVPNVIGAAAMGWVIADRARVRGLIERHAVAMRAFSWVTILFHVVFLAIYGDAFGLSGTILIAAPITILFGWMSANCRNGWKWIVGALVYALSASLLLGHWYGAAASAPLAFSLRPASDLLMLAPVCVFGFALCPYLDLTFLAARGGTSARESKGAFGIGFGVLFLSMILGTLMYTPWANGRTGAGLHSAVLPLDSVTVLGVHVAAQSLFTIWVHSQACANAIRQDHAPELRRMGVPEIGPVLIAVCVGLVATVFVFEGYTWTRFDSREIAYRYFMGFYGLVFPAYVWLCMIPTRDGHSGITGAAGRRKLTILTVAVILALPCFVLGFMSGREWWLAPGLGIVLASRLLIRRAADGGNPVPSTSAQTPTL